eukprot:TRINITY_DN11331_c0_g1_i1.p1 TRINITY_DN11331_c0_g1~~TRINITY_DN11331_c0_g1_i1.p1  ORF type:complete len:183 (+),score=20.78 TRINITY_DN11331_c0_g1_i1:32-580(+)
MGNYVDRNTITCAYVVGDIDTPNSKSVPLSYTFIWLWTYVFILWPGKKPHCLLLQYATILILLPVLLLYIGCIVVMLPIMLVVDACVLLCWVGSRCGDGTVTKGFCWYRAVKVTTTMKDLDHYIDTYTFGNWHKCQWGPCCLVGPVKLMRSEEVNLSDEERLGNYRINSPTMDNETPSNDSL